LGSGLSIFIGGNYDSTHPKLDGLEYGLKIGCRQTKLIMFTVIAYYAIRNWNVTGSHEP